MIIRIQSLYCLFRLTRKKGKADESTLCGPETGQIEEVFPTMLAKEPKDEIGMEYRS